MRRIFVAIVVLLVAVASVTLVACGPDDEAVEPVPETDPLPAPVVEQDVDDPDLSPIEEAVYEPFPVDPEVGVPDAIQSRLDAGQPMIILFIDETQKTTDDQQKTIDDVTDKYQGLIDLVTFDVSRFVTHDADGRITVQSEINADETGRQVARMIDEDNLDIRFTPFTLIVDDQGYVTWRYRGISDGKTLEREVLRVTE